MYKELVDALGDLAIVTPIHFVGEVEAAAWDLHIGQGHVAVVYRDVEGAIRSIGRVSGTHESVDELAARVRAKFPPTE